MTKIENLDELLVSEDINNSIIDLDNFIGEVCAYGDEMKKLTEPQRKFYFNQCLEREINNGGFNQYFLNSSGDFAHQTVLSLREISANATADILQLAIDQFPDKTVPQDRAKRLEMIEKIEENANSVWEELDQIFFEYADNLNELNINFVKQNKSEF